MKNRNASAKFLPLITLLLLLTTACSPPPPVKIGFVGGLSGRVADLGIAGRNGAIFAIEQRNAAGGINGRKVELLVRDDKQDADVAKQMVEELIEQKSEAIIGHMTSSMSLVTVPLINQQRIVMVSPTATTDQLKNIDDYFFRVISHTQQYAAINARYQLQKLGHKRISVAYDLDNKAYTASWFDNFKQTFESLGGKIINEITFISSPNVHYSEIARQLLADNPDGVQIIASAMDSAMITQQLRKETKKIPIATSEWAATEKLIGLGGDAVEGVLLAQFFDRGQTTPDYLAFRERYIKRFSHEPGFAEIAGYDAATVILDALAAKNDKQSLKQTILSIATFQGAQGKLTIDAYGDTLRKTYLTRVIDGKFEMIKDQ